MAYLNPDQKLVAEVIKEPAKFTALYRQHVDKVYRYLLARTGSTLDAQDLTSDVFLKALESIKNYRGEGSFAAWLMGIARFTVADYFRARGSILSVEHTSIEDMTDIPSKSPLPESVVAERWELEQVIKVLNLLSPDRANALSLYVFAGLSIEEISHILQKSEPAVRMLIYRATKDVKEKFVFEDNYSYEYK